MTLLPGTAHRISGGVRGTACTWHVWPRWPLATPLHRTMHVPQSYIRYWRALPRHLLAGQEGEEGSGLSLLTKTWLPDSNWYSPMTTEGVSTVLRKSLAPSSPPRGKYVRPPNPAHEDNLEGGSYILSLGEWRRTPQSVTKRDRHINTDIRNESFTFCYYT